MHYSIVLPLVSVPKLTHTRIHTPTHKQRHLKKEVMAAGFGWQTFLLDLRDCCSALDAVAVVAVVVIVIVIITALAKVVVVVLAFIDLPPH